MKYKTFEDIPQFTKTASYTVHIPWDFLEKWIESQQGREYSIDLDPDFQRPHVWSEFQQKRYVEFILRGGASGRDIHWNHPNWMGSFVGTLVLVDGKQRIEAVRRFLRDDLVVFDNQRLSDFEGGPRASSHFFVFHVNDLKTRAELLQWYIDLNDGGVAHTEKEIREVRELLEEEKGRRSK